jgi:tetratricopeptide (TPR) repeat protein
MAAGWLLGLALLAAEPLPPPLPVLPERLQPPDPASVMQIPLELKVLLRQRIVARRGDQRTQLGQLVEFLFDQEHGLGVRYDDDATLTVAEIGQHRTANCLSFTLLTVALARELGIDTFGQDLADTLMWRQEDRTLYHATHVNAGVWIGRSRFSVDVASDRVLTRHEPRRISDNRLLAQFYNNRSAELMAQDLLEAALAHSNVSLKLDPDYATSWNNAGVVHLRAGRAAEAENHYLRALALDPNHASALANLVNHYERGGRPERAVAYRQRLNDVQQRNPFHHYLLALDLEQQQRWDEAIDGYRRAIKLWDGEHRFHFGLARAYFQTGRLGPASRELERARTLAQGETKALYQAKLAALERAPR